jgi:hypothetical protein
VDSGSARHGERGEALADKASENGEAPAERAIATRKEGLASSQHAPRKTQADKPAVKILKRLAVDNRTDQPTSEAASPIPGYGAVHKPQGTCADIVGRNSTQGTKKGGDDVFQIVGRGGRVAKETVADELGPFKRGNAEDARKVIFPRDGHTPHPEGSVTAIASAVSIALFKVGTPDHIRLWSLRKNENGVLTGLVKERTNAEQFLKYHDTILLAARKADSGIVGVESNETWARFKLHRVRLDRYMSDDPREGLQLLHQGIEAENPELQYRQHGGWWPPGSSKCGNGRAS